MSALLNLGAFIGGSAIGLCTNRLIWHPRLAALGAVLFGVCLLGSGAPIWLAVAVPAVGGTLGLVVGNRSKDLR